MDILDSKPYGLERGIPPSGKCTQVTNFEVAWDMKILQPCVSYECHIFFSFLKTKMGKKSEHLLLNERCGGRDLVVNDSRWKGFRGKENLRVVWVFLAGSVFLQSEADEVKWKGESLLSQETTNLTNISNETLNIQIRMFNL